MTARKISAQSLVDTVRRVSMAAYRVVVVGLVILAVMPFVLPSRSVNSFDADGFPTSAMAVVGAIAALVLLFAAGFILLPMGPRRLVTIDGDRLVVATLLGRRRIRLDRLTHVGAVRLYSGNGPDTSFAVLRQDRARVIVVDHYSWLPANVRVHTLALRDRNPSGISRRARWRLGIDPRPSPWARTFDGIVTCAGFTTYLVAALLAWPAYGLVLHALVT